MPRYIAVLILFLTIPSLSQVLMLHINEEKPGSAFCLKCDHRKKTECVQVEDVTIRQGRYECVSGETAIKKTALKNARIELEQVIKHINKYVPENLRLKDTLEKKMNSNFLKDFNKMTLLTGRDHSASCYNINIYDNEKLIATFETDGVVFYDRKNKLMYKLYIKDGIYNPEENFLRKYWGIFAENHCR